MSIPQYQIKDWSDIFENNKSRVRDKLSWCPIPNKQDGLGYGRIMMEPDGAAIYGAFVAVVLVASKQKRAREGHLTDTGGADGCPYSASDLAVKVRLPPDVIQRMLDVVSSANVGWLTKTDIYDESAPRVPPECPQGAPSRASNEQNRTERNGSEEKTTTDVFQNENQEKIKAWFDSIEKSCEVIMGLECKPGKHFNPKNWVQLKAQRHGHPGAIDETLKGVLESWASIENIHGWIEHVWKVKNQNWNEAETVAIDREFKKAD